MSGCQRLRLSVVAVVCAATQFGVPISVFAAEPQASERLARTIIRDSGAALETPTRGWSIRDIVDISAIVGTAVSEQRRQIGFIVRQPSLDAGDILYGLYVVDVDGSQPARKLLESRHIALLSRNPDDHSWTALADVGAGVQIYDIDDTGAFTPLVVNTRTVPSGTAEDVIPGVYEPRLAGIISYEWSPDGASLWYSRARLRPPSELQRFLDQGITYDDRTMAGTTYRSHPGELLGIELHVLRRILASDRTVAFVPSSGTSNTILMHREYASVYWTPDSTHILYSTYPQSADGQVAPLRWSVNVDSGQSVPIAPTLRLPEVVPTADGTHYLSVLSTSDGNSHLAEYGTDGRQISEGGKVPFTSIGLLAGMGAWRDTAGQSEILAVRYATHNGLIRIPESGASRILLLVKDNLTNCSFAKDLHFGACVRDNVTLPPELVLVDTAAGALKTMVRPNSRYDAIAPLRIERASWKNRYGNLSDGYITYPRNFDSTRRYPTIVVTHAAGARNEFVDRGFQAEIPIQVLAEAGYVVLSVNEVRASYRTRALLHERGKGQSRARVAQTQFTVISDPVASVEAAVKDAIDRGIADPEKTGIAGYSRGAEVVLYAMTQSKMFHAASVGDGAPGANADGYWSWGTRGGRQWYTSLYGGSAYDANPAVRDKYLSFAPAFRTQHFAGPLLEQSTAVAASGAFERLIPLTEAGIPMELDFYPHESHILWHPRHYASAMQRNVDWFNYWLLGKSDSDPLKNEQYARWQAMADIYSARHPKPVTRRK